MEVELEFELHRVARDVCSELVCGGGKVAVALLQNACWAHCSQAHTHTHNLTSELSKSHPQTVLHSQQCYSKLKSFAVKAIKFAPNAVRRRTSELCERAQRTK